MNSTQTNTPARAGLPIEEIERLSQLQRESRALRLTMESRAIRDRIAAQVRKEKRSPVTLPDASMKGLLESYHNSAHAELDANATRVSYLGEYSPLFRWFAAMCGVATVGMVAMALLGSATPDAVIIVTLAAGITGLALGAIGYLLGGAK